MQGEALAMSLTALLIIAAILVALMLILVLVILRRERYLARKQNSIAILGGNEDDQIATICVSSDEGTFIGYAL